MTPQETVGYNSSAGKVSSEIGGGRDMAVAEVQDSQFQEKVLEASGPVLVDFWAPWCGPCRKLAPILEEVAEELGDRLTVLKMNTDENPQTPGRFAVMSIPTLIFFRDGQEVQRFVGVMSKGQLKSKLEELLAG